MSESFLPVAIRVWPKLRSRHGQWDPEELLKSSRWSLVFDTETTVDAGQLLRVGCFRLLRDGMLVREGLFHEVLDATELRLLECYGEEHRLPILSIVEFREFFYECAGELRATIVGFNLPFDLSRLAVDWKPGRRRFAGGFSLILWLRPDGSENKDRPRIRIKALDNGAAMIEFTRRRRDKRRHKRPAQWLGRFLDLATLTRALTGETHSLESASRTFRTSHRKLSGAEHGKSLTRRYLRYLRRDVLVTEELLEKLLAEYARHPIELDPSEAYSSASIAKAYLDAFGFTPPGTRSSVSDEEVGHTMAAFFGGRAEIHHRRELVPVTYVDVESTYPTLFTLQELTRFLRAEEIRTEEVTAEVKRFVEYATPKVLLDPEVWSSLTVIIELEADDDTLPVRTTYGRADPKLAVDPVTEPLLDVPVASKNPRRKSTRSIAVNRLSTPNGTAYYALADVLAAKFLAGQAPKIKRATACVPVGIRDGLRPVRLRDETVIDPREGELFKQVVEARQQVRSDQRLPELERKARQRFLKTFSNSGAYGIFAEFNAQPPGKPRPIEIFCDRSFETRLQSPERPGRYCFPPLACFITAAARLVLALLEQLVAEAGGSWLATDTDSMAILTDYGEAEQDPALQKLSARRDALPVSVVDAIIERFRPLWPYASEGNIWKLEKENFDPKTGGRRPLYALAIAAKRYALLNFDADGTRIIRKRMEHGLGLYPSPYGEDSTGRWIDELWEDIADDALGLPLKQREWHCYPLIGRVPVTSWDVLTAFSFYNDANPDSPVRPFNFVSAAYMRPLTRAERVRLFAPFVAEPAKAIEAEWYVQGTGARVEITTEDPHGVIIEGVIPVKTYGDLLFDYAYHPEVKFADGDGERCKPTTGGQLQRRHVIATRVEPIGKEGRALGRHAEGPGVADEMQQLYADPSDFQRYVLPVARAMPRAILAEAIGMTERGLRKVLNGHSVGTPASRARIAAISGLWAARELGRKPSDDPADDSAAWLAAQSLRCSA